MGIVVGMYVRCGGYDGYVCEVWWVLWWVCM